MTLFGFPRRHLYSCILVENGCEAFSLAHSRSSVGGGTVINALFSNQHCSSWEQCHIKTLEFCGIHTLGSPGGGGRLQAMRHSVHHFSPRIFQELRKIRPITFSWNSVCGKVMKPGLRNGRPTVETDFLRSGSGKLVWFLSLDLLEGSVRSLRSTAVSSELTYMSQEPHPLHHLFLYCIMLAWLSVAFTSSTGSQPSDSWHNHHVITIPCIQQGMTQKEASLCTSLDHASGFPPQKGTMQSWLLGSAIHLHRLL